MIPLVPDPPLPCLPIFWLAVVVVDDPAADAVELVMAVVTAVLLAAPIVDDPEELVIAVDAPADVDEQDTAEGTVTP